MIFSFGFAWGDDPQNLPYTPLILQVNQWYGFLTLAPPAPQISVLGRTLRARVVLNWAFQVLGKRVFNIEIWGQGGAVLGLLAKSGY